MNEIDKKAVGFRIRLIRKENGWTMEQFGEKVKGTKKSNVSKWERGLSTPHPSKLPIIAELGNMTVKQLVYGEQ